MYQWFLMIVTPQPNLGHQRSSKASKMWKNISEDKSVRWWSESICGIHGSSSAARPTEGVARQTLRQPLSVHHH